MKRFINITLYILVFCFILCAATDVLNNVLIHKDVNESVCLNIISAFIIMIFIKIKDAKG